MKKRLLLFLLLLFFAPAPELLAQLAPEVKYDAEGCEMWERIGGPRRMTNTPIKTDDQLLDWYAPRIVNGRAVYDKPIHDLLRSDGDDPVEVYEKIKNREGLSHELVPAVDPETGQRRKYAWTGYSETGPGGSAQRTKACVTAYWSEPEWIWILKRPNKPELDTPEKCGQPSKLVAIMVDVIGPLISVVLDKFNDANLDGVYNTNEVAPSPGLRETFRYRPYNPSNFPVRIVRFTDEDDLDETRGMQPICSGWIGTILPPNQKPTDDLPMCMESFDNYSPPAGKTRINTARVTVEEVNNPKNRATDTAQSSITTKAAITLELDKEVQNVDNKETAWDKQTKALPENTVRFRIPVGINGLTEPQRVIVHDKLPEHITLKPGSLRIAASQASAQDEMALFNQGLTVELKPGDQIRVLTFEATISGRNVFEAGRDYTLVNNVIATVAGITKEAAATVIVQYETPGQEGGQVTRNPPTKKIIAGVLTGLGILALIKAHGGPPADICGGAKCPNGGIPQP